MSDDPRPYDLLAEFFKKYGKDMDVRSFEAKWGNHGDGYYTKYTIKVGGYDAYEWCNRKKYWWKSKGLGY